MSSSTDEWNAWAMAKNREPGGTRHGIFEVDPVTGYSKSITDPYFSSSEYINSADSPYGEPTADASLMWASSSPDDILYSSGGNWNPLTEEALLGNTDLLNSYYMELNKPGAAQGAYTTFNAGLSPETQAMVTGLSGSSHNVATEVPGGQTEIDRLLGSMWSSNAKPPKV